MLVGWQFRHPFATVEWWEERPHLCTVKQSPERLEPSRPSTNLGEHRDYLVGSTNPEKKLSRVVYAPSPQAISKCGPVSRDAVDIFSTPLVRIWLGTNAFAPREPAHLSSHLPTC